MKIIFRGLAFPLILAMAIAALGENAGMASYNSVKLVQLSSIPNQKTDLKVAVPESATIIVRKEGKPSLTGHLTAFNEQNLTLLANGYSETLPLTQVKSIEFNGDVWIEGQRLPSRIREHIKTLEGLPIKAFKLVNPQKKALISLKTMTSEGLERFLKKIGNKPYGVKTIVFDSPEKMTIQIAEIE